MPHNIPAFFESYANLYNRALAGEDVFDEIMNRFSPQFVAAGPQGISTGKQGAAFRRTLEKGYRFYREIGTRKMVSKRVEVTPIDAAHAMAKVFYCADHVKPDGSPLRIDFEVTYFLDTSTLKPKIFGFVAGDEMGLYKQHGLIPEKAAPAPKPRPKPRLPESERQRLH
ncbi:MAG TPA: hypothetical protein VFV70_09160 [Hyphomonadaceae bacterium]|nr:hypothetical protein [Hyphomonadaceae bacterium]